MLQLGGKIWFTEQSGFGKFEGQLAKGLVVESPPILYPSQARKADHRCLGDADPKPAFGLAQLILL